MVEIRMLSCNGCGEEIEHRAGTSMRSDRQWTELPSGNLRYLGVPPDGRPSPQEDTAHLCPSCTDELLELLSW